MSRFLNNTYLIAALMALVQSAVLYFMIESRASILRNGREIVLQTQPVDPHDLMRGDFVTLGYPLSRLEVSVIGGTPPAEAGRHNVYIALVKDGADPELWTFSRASWQPIADLKPDEVVLAGTTPDYFTAGSSGTVSLTYGIERYYVPEGQGKPIEEGVREKAVHVVVAVNGDGKAQIKALRMDGQTLYDEPIY